MEPLEWYDSADPRDRRRNLGWWPQAVYGLTRTGGERLGDAYYAERQKPGDIWPAGELVASRVTRERAAGLARARGLHHGVAEVV